MAYILTTSQTNTPSSVGTGHALEAYASHVGLWTLHASWNAWWMNKNPGEPVGMILNDLLLYSQMIDVSIIWWECYIDLLKTNWWYWEPVYQQYGWEVQDPAVQKNRSNLMLVKVKVTWWFIQNVNPPEV